MPGIFHFMNVILTKTRCYGSRACVQVKGNLSGWFSISAGLSFVMLHWLFNIMDVCMQEEKISMSGFDIGLFSNVSIAYR